MPSPNSTVTVSSVLAEPPHRYDPSGSALVAVRCQDLVQVRAVQREAGADVPPQGGEVDVGQQAAPVVAEALVGISEPARQPRTPSQEHAAPVPRCRQVDARPGVRPGGFPLDHVGGETALPERSGGAETGDPGADHENAQTGRQWHRCFRSHALAEPRSKS